MELPKTMGTDAPMRDASSAEARKLWNPKSTGTFKASAVGGLGGAEGTNAEHEGNVKSQDSAPPVVFESILIFGGVADGKVVGVGGSIESQWSRFYYHRLYRKNKPAFCRS